MRSFLIPVLCITSVAAAEGLWTESFTGANGTAPANWTISTTGGSTLNIQNNALAMSSTGNGEAYGYPNKAAFPALSGWDLTLPYRVEFDFRLPDANNHWFFVYVDQMAHTVIDYGDDFTYRSGAVNTKIMDLGTSWHHIRYDVRPAAGSYDIRVDGALKVTGAAFLGVAGPWDPFWIGDRAPGSVDFGSASWDNLEIVTNIPEPATLVLLSAGLAGLARRLRRRLGW